jgi:hypothetical protein
MYVSVIRIILLLTLLVALDSCRWKDVIGTPFVSFTKIKIPRGTPAFQKGFEDGCLTGQYSRGNQFYRTNSGFRFDPKMISNSEYLFGHKRGYSVCFVKFAGTSDGPNISFDRALNPGGYDSTFNAQDINTAWGGMFNGVTPSMKGSLGNGVDGIFDIWSGGSKSNSVLGANPLWSAGSKGQIFGQAK